MTNTLRAVWQIWCVHGSKVMGGIIGTITALTSCSVIPESHLKYWMAAVTLLTFWRGYSFPPPAKSEDN